MVPLILPRSLPTALTMLLLMTTQRLPSTRLNLMMEMVLFRVLTLSTFPTAVFKLLTTVPMTMMDLLLRSAMRELLPTLRLLLTLLPMLQGLPMLQLLPTPHSLLMPLLWPMPPSQPTLFPIWPMVSLFLILVNFI